MGVTKRIRSNRNIRARHEKVLGRHASAETSREHYVVKNVVDALIEEDEKEDPLALTDKQKGIIFLLLQTLKDVLDQNGTKS